MANMLILFYLFSDGKLEDNLVGIFNLFDADGNKVSDKHSKSFQLVIFYFNQFWTYL